MLDFSRLKTPPHDGDVLVLPSPGDCARAVANNSKRLNSADRPLLDGTLRDVRRATRESVAGNAGTPIVALGHQPEFIHPGVWAKHVVAQRLAGAIRGRAINLVVDNDAPREIALAVPVVRADLFELRRVPVRSVPPGWAYEQLPALAGQDLDGFELTVRDSMGERFQRSQMPTLLQVLREAADSGDWPKQMVSGRKVIERSFGVEVQDENVSEVWWHPLLADVLLNAERFASFYNAALRWYRESFHVRGAQRPIPDLALRDGAVEVPAWAYRAYEPRRRVYARRNGNDILLTADDQRIAQVAVASIRSLSQLPETVRSWAPWRIRPRALMLTMWARLLLADLFIHGIGGAKYDRITDRIIHDFYGLQPPEMACVSATLLLDLPKSGATIKDHTDAVRRVRDAEWNTHGRDDSSSSDDLKRLQAERQAALAASVRLKQTHPGDRAARREAFLRLRQASDGLADLMKREKAAAIDDLARVNAALGRDQSANSREYFFGLYDRPKLERLLAALPAEADFRV